MLSGEAATRCFADDIAAILGAGDCLCLSGDLGAGKTTFARALLRALAADAALEVPSPTFTLVQPYDLARFPVAHFDLYRIGDAAELAEIGFDEALGAGVALIEWPERAEEAMPAGALWLRFDIADAGAARRVRLATRRPERWARRLESTAAARALTERAGLGGAARRWLQGDASSRSYERIMHNERSAVLMSWPAPAETPATSAARAYAATAHIQSDPAAFVGVAEGLRRHGFVAPELLGADPAARLYLFSDLGSLPVVEGGAPIADRYLAAAELLADLALAELPDAVDLGDVFGDGTRHRHVVPPYDHAALAIELSLFTEWWIPHRHGRPATEDERAEFEGLWAPLVDRLVAAEPVWVLRDFHSPNLLWQPAGEGRRRLGLVDVQDTVIGPSAYDLASLAYDARVDVPADLRAAIIDTYLAARAAAGRPVDRDAFVAEFHIAAAQRLTKIFGGFARLARRDGKPGYLRHVPRLETYLREALADPVLAGLSLWYERHLPGA
ncbi:tRNA (adenosine(37)-N6)-threonylcarbamoyltransferase complex ATPase subunit type 1 TsaE [Methylobrevis sp. L22]|uniref:tRNA threonylcarbamoyladenosine biosynthesis protein TsaE n=1 Tax=Methylobrevis albus TaxID=2793297 RepID=A0A931I242_9HYPH|nr:tRNA (adenosine(37)-N6)-threonylcarbamoyltransferase complex ATPase subunit type 1 TsaE [Methylobrevis albus]